MSNDATSPIRVDKNFKEEVDDIKVKRIKNNKDKKLKSDRRITLAIVRHELWKKIKEDITNSPLKER